MNTPPPATEPASLPDATAQPHLPNEPASPPPAQGRLVSVDALRGFDMFWIIGGEGVAHALEKLGGGPFVATIAEQLKHAEWIGFRFYDVIFPLFLFLVGVSIVLSLERILGSGNRKEALTKIVRRACLLFAIGVFYYGGFSKPWPDIALSGVLPRIALCYLAAATLYLWLPRKGIIAATALILGAYWGLMTFVPFPDVNFKHPGGGKKATQAQAKAPEEILASATATTHGIFEEGRNLAHYVDMRWLPGRKRNVYYTNEGLLSTLPAIATTLFGVMAGWILTGSRWSGKRKALLLMGAGLTGVVLGLAWSFHFPLIKRIWTSSFCLVSSGCAAGLLGAFHLLVDVWGFKRWCTPFLWIGSNALAVYIAVNIVDCSALAARFAGGDVSQFLDSRLAPGFGGLLLATISLALPVGLARFLYSRKIFFRL